MSGTLMNIDRRGAKINLYRLTYFEHFFPILKAF